MGSNGQKIYGKRAKASTRAHDEVTDDYIVQRIEEEGYELTDDPNEAIYILRDGRMISGGFYGTDTRSEDHRMIESVFDDMNRYDSDFWQRVFARTGVVMLIPETNEAYGESKSKGGLTPQQRRVLQRVSRYTYKQFT